MMDLLKVWGVADNPVPVDWFPSSDYLFHAVPRAKRMETWEGLPIALCGFVVLSSRRWSDPGPDFGCPRCLGLA